MNLDNIGESVRESVWASARNLFRDYGWHCIDDFIWFSIHNPVWYSVQVYDQSSLRRHYEPK
jgi:hypothetical protein